MSNQKIKQVCYERQSCLIDRQDKFEFRKDKKFKSIQKICFYLLRKIGAFSQDETISYTEIHFDEDEFIEKIFKIINNMECIFNKRPKRILIGRDDFNKLMNKNYIMMQKIEFDTKYRYGNSSGYSIMGLHVEIIPWMEGILVMPE
jgi:hypothetical protein